MKTLTTLTCLFVAISAAQAQDKLPDDVRRLLPKNEKSASEIGPITTSAIDSDDLIDQHISRALLRYRNIAESSGQLNDAWHQQMSERLDRVKTYLDALRKQDAEKAEAERREALKSTKLEPKSPLTLAPPASVEKVSNEVEVIRPASGETRDERSKLVIPTVELQTDDVTCQNKPETTTTQLRIRMLEDLASQCETVAKELRLTVSRLTSTKAGAK